ncbi:hypothetical protein [Helicobacter sp. 23-1045]
MQRAKNLKKSVIARSRTLGDFVAIYIFLSLLPRSTYAKRRISNFPLPCGGGLMGWVDFILDSAILI